MSLGVKEYYDRNAEYEWGRLDRHPYEFEITTRIMNRYIKPGQSILDIGGGPGRYSIYYAKRGCNVTLLDLSESNVNLALIKSVEEGVQLRACAQNCLTIDPGEYGMYDHVFLMGPLYHLWNAKDRDVAVENAIACLNRGGYLYASFIMTFAHILYCLQHEYYLMREFEGKNGSEIMQSLRERRDWGVNAFTWLHSYNSQNIEPFMEKFGLNKVTLFGQEGILAPNYQDLMRRTDSEQELWLKVALDLCELPEFLTYSEHAMYIGKKPL